MDNVPITGIWRCFCTCSKTVPQRAVKDRAYSLPLFEPGMFKRFANPWDTFKFPSLWTIIKAVIRNKNESGLPTNYQELEEHLPVVCGDLTWFSKTKKSSKKLKFMWLGHASCLVQVDGVTVLLDPVFSERASATQLLGPRRYRPVPCNITDLPHIDVVALSHTHYDHLDYNSVYEIHKRYGNHIQWLVPVGLKKWIINNVKALDSNVTELTWWQTFNVSSNKDTEGEVKFVFTPAQHWGSRSAWDRNRVLWGGWAVIGSQHRFLFTGDTGYCETFREIGTEYGPFDLAAIPIGAYSPREMMKSQHVNPEEAVQIHEDVQSQRSVGIHWGTFTLGFEHYLEPRERLRKCMEGKGGSKPFHTVKHGEILECS